LGGRPARLVLTEDLGERRRLELALQESEMRFRAFMDHIPAAAVIKDLEGRYLYVNSRLADLYGLPVTELVGKTHFERLPEYIIQRSRETDEAALGNEAIHFFQTAPDRDGTARSYMALKFPIRDPVGRTLLGTLAIDVTDQQRTAEALSV